MLRFGRLLLFTLGALLLFGGLWLAWERAPAAVFIAFLSNRDDNSEIYLMSAAGGAPQRITASQFGQGFCWLAWVPGGGEFLTQFGTTRGGTFFCPEFGRATHRVARFGGPLSAPISPRADVPRSLAPDGSAVLFGGAMQGAGAVLTIQPLDDNSPRDLADITNREGAEIALWSPDGAWIVYSDDADRNLSLELYRLRPSGEGADAPPLQVPAVRICPQAAISPDSAWVVFAVQEQTGCNQLWRTRLDADVFGAQAEPFAQLPQGLTTFSQMTFNP
ncbi:MAG: TolB family protein, partial [Anaerolineales bacterium]